MHLAKMLNLADSGSFFSFLFYLLSLFFTYWQVMQYGFGGNHFL